MTKRLDLTGQKYGRLLVTDMAPKTTNVVHWNCVCECGAHKVVSTTHLRSGHTKSCGCMRSESSARTAKANAKHGMWRSPEFGVWSKMLARCYNPNNKKYPLYGGRGIAVCAEWRNDFAAFFAHVGPRPSAFHSIDRIDGNKGYEPGNVRWATIDEQNNNRSSNVLVTMGDVTKTLAQWSRETGIPHNVLRYRLGAGWPVQRLFSEVRK